MRIAYKNGEDLSKVGGGRVHFRAVASELANLGHDVYVVAPQYNSTPWVEFHSEDVKKIKLRVPGKNVLGYFCYQLQVLLLLPWFKFKYKWDVLLVRGGGPSPMNGLIFLFARLLGIRVVLECNGVSWLEFKSRGFPSFICKYVQLSAWFQAKTASSLIGVTPAICRAYCTLAKRPIKDSCPISNGVFTEKFPLDQRQEIRKAYGWDDSHIVFIMPSGFAPWHGLNELVEALSILTPDVTSRVRFVLPGKGKMFDEIKTLIIQQNLDSFVQLPGILNRDEIHRILVAADIGMLLRPKPGKFEIPGSPLKLFEYFGAGLPVIACSDSYHSQLIPYYSLGIVLDENTPDAIARAICEIVDTGGARFDRQKILATARNEFDWCKVAERVASVLQGTEPQLEQWISSGS